MVLFSDFQQVDTGLYTCVASSENEEASSSAVLTMDSSFESQNGSSSQPFVVFKAPSKPVVVNTTANSLTISWKYQNSSGFPSGFTVEYFSPKLETGWVLVAKGWNSTILKVFIEMRLFKCLDSFKNSNNKTWFFLFQIVQNY